MNSNIKLIIELLDSPIAFNPAFARIVGNNLNSGMLLSQLFYWAKTKNFEEFYKVSTELQDECFLGRSEFEAARKKITDAGIFKLIKKGMPCKTFYHIDLEVLINLLHGLSDWSANKPAENQQTSLLKTNKQECRKPASMTAENQHYIIDNREYTENTTDSVPPIPPVGEMEKCEVDDNPFNQNEKQALKRVFDNAFKNWKQIASEHKFEFTNCEWGAIGVYCEAKSYLPVHTIRAHLIQLDKWGRQGLDIEDVMLRSVATKALVSPLQAKVYDKKNNRIHDVEIIALARQNLIEAEHHESIAIQKDKHYG